ncbi:hypothetical protein FRC09_005531 [Ceratobasidium sp. 395]|nr:hypothetical protein FRC09_005531 [Ceratobasidium sp. 395]
MAKLLVFGKFFSYVLGDSNRELLLVEVLQVQDLYGDGKRIVLKGLWVKQGSVGRTVCTPLRKRCHNPTGSELSGEKTV